MYYQHKNKIRSRLWLLLSCMALAMFWVSTEAQAFLGLVEPKIEIVIPSQIDEGGITPIYINAKRFDEDPIKTLTLSMDGNPDNHRLAFRLTLDKPQPMLFISTRMRMAASGVSPITIHIKQVSGKEMSKSFPSGNVMKVVDFSNPETLNVTFKGAFVFPKDDIGQPMVTVRKKKGDDSELEFRTILHHPMLPVTNDSQGFYVNSIEIQYENEPLARLETYDGMTNDPYLQINIKDDKSVGKAKVIWRDTKGFSYEKTN